MTSSAVLIIHAPLLRAAELASKHLPVLARPCLDIAQVDALYKPIVYIVNKSYYFMLPRSRWFTMLYSIEHSKFSTNYRCLWSWCCFTRPDFFFQLLDDIWLQRIYYPKRISLHRFSRYKCLCRSQQRYGGWNTFSRRVYVPMSHLHW